MANALSKTTSSLIFVEINVMQHVTGNRIVYFVVWDFLLKSEQLTLSSNCFFKSKSPNHFAVIFSFEVLCKRAISTVYFVNWSDCVLVFVSIALQLFLFLAINCMAFSTLFSVSFMLFSSSYFAILRSAISTFFGSIKCIKVKRQYSSVCES